MPQKRKYTPLPQRSAKKCHISQASITRLTVSRYVSAMNSFFVWRRAKGLGAEVDFADLDLQLGEYLNHLYQNERPLYLGINCIAGFKKLRPRCKKHIDTAVAWLNNWAKVTVKVQAMPLHICLVKAFVSYGLLKREYDFALSLYVGFLGLLRGCEILDLHMADVQARGPNQVVLVLRDTKGARLRNVPFETVTIRDPLAIKILLKRKTVGGPKLFNCKRSRLAELYKNAVSFFRLSHPKPTPHGIRRGGASWHFGIHGSYDRTVEHGRWASVKSARIYINEAAAEESAMASCEKGKLRLKDGVDLRRPLLRRSFAV
jgi:integrase